MWHRNQSGKSRMAKPTIQSVNGKVRSVCPNAGVAKEICFGNQKNMIVKKNIFVKKNFLLIKYTFGAKEIIESIKPKRDRQLSGEISFDIALIFFEIDCLDFLSYYSKISVEENEAGKYRIAFCFLYRTLAF